jgi:hypothetical protein
MVESQKRLEDLCREALDRGDLGEFDRLRTILAVEHQHILHLNGRYEFNGQHFDIYDDWQNAVVEAHSKDPEDPHPHVRWLAQLLRIADETRHRHFNVKRGEDWRAALVRFNRWARDNVGMELYVNDCALALADRRKFRLGKKLKTGSTYCTDETLSVWLGAPQRPGLRKKFRSRKSRVAR